MILCGLLRVSVGLWIEKLQISTAYIIISKDVYALRVIYDLITLLLLACCNIVPLSNLITYCGLAEGSTSVKLVGTNQLVNNLLYLFAVLCTRITII